MAALQLLNPQQFSLPLFLSVISPLYRAAPTLAELLRRVTAAASAVTEDYEIVLVDDRSPDETWGLAQAAAAQNPRIRVLRLSRNFGQHRAITAGLDACLGEWVVVLDCDLQDQPEEVPALLAVARNGPFDLVQARRIGRQDAWAKRLLSGAFHRSLSYLTGARHDPAVGNFGIYHRRVIAAVLRLREDIRYFPAQVRWVGFRAGTLDVAHAGRAGGESTYRLGALFDLALDIILANSDKPIRLAVKTGLAVAAGAFALVPVTLLRYWAGAITDPGYASLILSVWFFSGLLLAGLGVVGLYVGKTFEQTKGRPLYIVDEELNAPSVGAGS